MPRRESRSIDFDRPGPDLRPDITGHLDRPSWLKCRHCRAEFPLDAPGTRHRNHCPYCLWSVHLDHTPGDRASDCRGGMEPIAIMVDRSGEWHVVHRCGTCHAIHVNRIAGDDDERALLALAIRPLSRLPFPV